MNALQGLDGSSPGSGASRGEPDVRFGVVVFPGSNCDMDCYWAIRLVLGREVQYVWHEDESLDRFDCVILPGGFSYGDYLRTGAIARFSPVMDAVERFASRGGLVIGICNGFQILLEAGLLPGAMLKNDSLRFRCHDTFVRVENSHTPFTHLTREGQVLRIPIAHFEGNYYIDPEGLEELKKNRQIVFRYSDPSGKPAEGASAGWNPNGATYAIAGICNKAGNVLGMMPHPERRAEREMGGSDGKVIFESIVRWVMSRGWQEMRSPRGDV